MANLEHLIRPKVGGTNPLVSHTFESAGAQAPAAPTPFPYALVLHAIKVELFASLIAIL